MYELTKNEYGEVWTVKRKLGNNEVSVGIDAAIGKLTHDVRLIQQMLLGDQACGNEVPEAIRKLEEVVVEVKRAHILANRPQRSIKELAALWGVSVITVHSLL